MATTIILKNSGTADKIPLATDLELGEVALNYADGKLFYKTGTNTIEYFNAKPDYGSVKSVDINPALTGLTFTGGPITTSGEFLVGGILALEHGGTGADNAIDARTALLPTQSESTEGLFLASNGTDVAWSSLSSNTITSGLGYTPVDKAGDTMTGSLLLNADPAVPLGAATKRYVDNVATGLNIHLSCRAATTQQLTASYNNGSAGIGATLTGSGFFPILDGVNLQIGDRILVKDQTDKRENGIYRLVANTTDWVLMRTDDFDNSFQGEISGGDALFVQEGIVLGTTQWVLISFGSLTIGTSDIEFSQFGGPGTYLAGDGISLDGNTISNTGVTRLTAGNNSNINLTAATGNITISFAGVLDVDKGGTGASTQPAAANNILPPQSGYEGKYLKTNGTNVSWGDISITLQTASSTVLGGVKIGNNINVESDGTISVAAPFSGNYSDLADQPTQLSQFTNDTGFITLTALTWANVSATPTNVSYFNNDSGYITASDVTWSSIINKPSFATVATSGKIVDLVDVSITQPLVDGQVLAYDLVNNLWKPITPTNGTVTSVNISGGTTGLTTVGDAITTSGTITLDGILSVEHGGTGADDAQGARTNLGAAASGVNSDITELAGLTTTITVEQGGTGAVTPEGARENLGAAASGANSDITSLSGLTTALSVEQGGTGAQSLTGYVKGAGTSPLEATATIPFSDITGTVPVAQGGTGIAEYSVGDILYASDTDELAKLSPGTDGYFLKTQGAGLAPVWADPSTLGNLVWTASGNYRTLTGYREDGSVSTVRTAEFFGDKLRLTLATFTPTIIASVLPAAPNWDTPVASFTVIVDNPADIPDQYISGVRSITGGTTSALSTFSAGSTSATPAPGVDFTQTFTADADSYIRSSSTTIAGGTASAVIAYNYYNGNTIAEYTTSSSTVSVTWATPTLSASLASLTGNTFLQTYASTTYTVTVTGMASSSNFVHAVTASGGSVSNATGNGTCTFTEPIHKNNTATSRTVSVNTTFTRPASVTGTSYTVNLSATTASASATFTYPSLWLFTTSTSSVPTVTDIVSENSFAAGVTALGSQVKVFAGNVTNSESTPRAFWFAIRSSASQPTSFKTGPTLSLLSDVSITTGNNVSLQPTTPPAGYVAEGYTLYGITLQPGTTYVSIS